MDTLIMAEKLEALRRCIRRIEAKRADSADALQQDVDRQDIISLNLTRAVQLCVDMASHVLTDTDATAPQTMGETFVQLAQVNIISPELSKSMQAAVGFRNIAVHSYQAIDWAIVHRITTDQLQDFMAFAEAMQTLKK
ncbi:MAG: DUF86 domain-containing protein [Gammaproteobacteria bacterium]